MYQTFELSIKHGGNMNVLKGLIALSLLSSPLLATEIPVIGMNGEGEVVEEAVTQAEFKGWMKKAANATTEMVSSDQLPKTESQAGRSLKQIDMGLGFKAEVGLGDTVKASVEPTVTFKFKRSK